MNPKPCPSLWERPFANLAQVLFQEAGDALLVVDPVSLRILDINPITLKWTGLSRAALVGSEVTGLIHHEPDRAEWLSALQETRTFHSRAGYRLRTSGPDRWIPVSLTTSRLHVSAETTLALLALRDVRELHEALQQSQRIATELKRVLVSVQDCVWNAVIDPAGCWRYAYLSPVIERLTGQTFERFLENPAAYREFVHPEDERTHAQFILELEAGRSAQTEYRLSRKDGSIRWVSERVNCTRTDRTEGIHLFGILTDITERKQVEAERRQLEDQIQRAQKLESLGNLAGGVAHDFNNLLTAVLGYASLAQMQLPSASPVCPMLREIENAARRAAELTQQMLAYSGRGKFVIQPFRLDLLVQEMSKLLKTAATRKATLELQLDPATIEGDATQIRQMVMNLLTNASDALGSHSGVIRVATGVRQADAANLRSPYLPEELPAGQYVFLEVEDNGSGISQESLAKVFDPFFTTKFVGRGLGLAAVLGIVRGHRGTIKVTSAPGQGTTFEVLLPCVSVVDKESPASSRVPQVPRGQGSILLIEDEPYVRDYARRVLESAGYQVLPAEDGKEGLDLFARHRQEIVAVLVDLTMPRMDGLEVWQQLDSQGVEVPVVVMSGYNEQEVLSRFTGPSLGRFIHKPFRPSELLIYLHQLLSPKPGNNGR